MGIRVFDRQVDHLAEEFFPEPGDDAQAQLRAEYALTQPQQADHQIGCQHKEDRGFQIAIPLSGDDIHGFALQHGRIDTAERAAQHGGQHAEDQFLLFYKIRADAF